MQIEYSKSTCFLFSDAIDGRNKPKLFLKITEKRKKRKIKCYLELVMCTCVKNLFCAYIQLTKSFSENMYTQLNVVYIIRNLQYIGMDFYESWISSIDVYHCANIPCDSGIRKIDCYFISQKCRNTLLLAMYQYLFMRILFDKQEYF